MSLSERFKRWRKGRRLFKMITAAHREAEQAYLLGDYKYGDALFKRAVQLAAEYDDLMRKERVLTLFERLESEVRDD